MPNSEPVINITNLSKTYPPPTGQVLYNVGFSLYKKDVIALVGPSGAGKTTLANIIAGLDSEYSGSIKIDGKELSRYKPHIYRRQYVGVIFQHYYLIPPLTVFENVEIPLKIIGISKRERHKKVSEILKRVGMYGHKDKYPNQLSGGQAQRVAIARALVKTPKIIVADEPTGNLDTPTGMQIIQLIKELTEQINGVAIVITHDTEVIKTIKKRIYIRDGKIEKTKNLN